MAVKVNTYNYKGTKVNPVSLPGEIFSASINPQLVAQAVRVYLNNQRQARPKTKRRGEIVGSTRKIWAQKGTGRARHGDRYAPIFVGGGVAHGPRGLAPKKLKLSRKMRQKALFSALSNLVKEENLIVLKDADKINLKTKSADQLYKKILGSQIKKVLLVTNDDNKNIKRASKNLAYIDQTGVNSLNVYILLNHQKLIFTQEALVKLENLFINK